MSQILVVGSLAYDTIQTPSGKAERTLGGSANYFGLGASLLAKVNVVGVVGEDYRDEDYSLLKNKGVDVSGIQKVPGKTFHWEGSYEGDLNEAKTIATELNVFEHFKPEIPSHYANSEYLFLANIDPILQMEVLKQVKKPKVVACDTMNYWIQSKPEQVKQIVSKVDVLLVNEGEAKQLTKTTNAISAAEKIAAMGPKAVVIKRGEYGFVLFTEGKFFIMPAFPVKNVIDPTGAGDTFAAGFISHLAKYNLGLDQNSLKAACVHGCLLASFTVQDFGVAALKNLTLDEVEGRHWQYREIVAF